MRTRTRMRYSLGCSMAYTNQIGTSLAISCSQTNSRELHKFHIGCISRCVHETRSAFVQAKRTVHKLFACTLFGMDNLITHTPPTRHVRNEAHACLVLVLPCDDGQPFAFGRSTTLARCLHILRAERANVFMGTSMRACVMLGPSCARHLLYNVRHERTRLRSIIHARFVCLRRCGLRWIETRIIRVACAIVFPSFFHQFHVLSHSPFLVLSFDPLVVFANLSMEKLSVVCVV